MRKRTREWAGRCGLMRRDGAAPVVSSIAMSLIAVLRR